MNPDPRYINPVPRYINHDPRYINPDIRYTILKKIYIASPQLFPVCKTKTTLR